MSSLPLPPPGQSPQAAAPDRFATRAEALRYVLAQGWKVTQPTFYRHWDKGLVPREKDGTLLRKDLDGYAKRFLKALDGSSSGTSNRLLEQKAAADARSAEIRAERDEIELRRLKKEVIDTSRLSMELAARARVLKNGIRGLIHEAGPAWIRVVGGDPARLPDLVAAYERAIDQHLHRYADQRTFLATLLEEDGQ